LSVSGSKKDVSKREVAGQRIIGVPSVRNQYFCVHKIYKIVSG